MQLWIFILLTVAHALTPGILGQEYEQEEMPHPQPQLRLYMAYPVLFVEKDITMNLNRTTVLLQVTGKTFDLCDEKSTNSRIPSFSNSRSGGRRWVFHTRTFSSRGPDGQWKNVTTTSSRDPNGQWKNVTTTLSRDSTGKLTNVVSNDNVPFAMPQINNGSPGNSWRVVRKPTFIRRKGHNNAGGDIKRVNARKPFIPSKREHRDTQRRRPQRRQQEDKLNFNRGILPGFTEHQINNIVDKTKAAFFTKPHLKVSSHTIHDALKVLVNDWYRHGESSRGETFFKQSNSIASTNEVTKMVGPNISPLVIPPLIPIVSNQQPRITSTTPMYNLVPPLTQSHDLPRDIKKDARQANAQMKAHLKASVEFIETKLNDLVNKWKTNETDFHPIPRKRLHIPTLAQQTVKKRVPVYQQNQNKQTNSMQRKTVRTKSPKQLTGHQIVPPKTEHVKKHREYRSETFKESKKNPIFIPNILADKHRGRHIVTKRLPDKPKYPLPEPVEKINLQKSTKYIPKKNMISSAYEPDLNKDKHRIQSTKQIQTRDTVPLEITPDIHVPKQPKYEKETQNKRAIGNANTISQTLDPPVRPDQQHFLKNTKHLINNQPTKFAITARRHRPLNTGTSNGQSSKSSSKHDAYMHAPESPANNQPPIPAFPVRSLFVRRKRITKVLNRPRKINRKHTYDKSFGNLEYERMLLEGKPPGTVSIIPNKTKRKSKAMKKKTITNLKKPQFNYNKDAFTIERQLLEGRTKPKEIPSPTKTPKKVIILIKQRDERERKQQDKSNAKKNTQKKKLNPFAKLDNFSILKMLLENYYNPASAKKPKLRTLSSPTENINKINSHFNPGQSEINRSDSLPAPDIHRTTQLRKNVGSANVRKSTTVLEKAAHIPIIKQVNRRKPKPVTKPNTYSILKMLLEGTAGQGSTWTPSGRSIKRNSRRATASRKLGRKQRPFKWRRNRSHSKRTVRVVHENQTPKPIRIKVNMPTSGSRTVQKRLFNLFDFR